MSKKGKKETLIKLLTEERERQESDRERERWEKRDNDGESDKVLAQYWERHEKIKKMLVEDRQTDK